MPFVVTRKPYPRPPLTASEVPPQAIGMAKRAKEVLAAPAVGICDDAKLFSKIAKAADKRKPAAKKKPAKKGRTKK